MAEHGLWKGGAGVRQGLSFSIGSLPTAALAGIDRPHVGQQSLPTAWQTLCTPSPANFLRRGSCRHGATIPDMVNKPVAYGTWEEQELITRRSQQELDQLGRELHEV